MRRRTLLGGALALPAMPVAAQPAFAPTRPIRVLVPYPPGGVTDIAGRVVSDGFQSQRGWTSVVENKPGANGRIGMAEIMRARPDGTNLLIGGFGSHALPQAVTPAFPFDIRRDFTPVAKIAEFVNVLVVNPSLPVHSVAELVAYARARPRELNYGSSGNGASTHITAELFAAEAGVQLVHVPARGAPQSILALRQGEIHLIFENLPAVRGQIREGALRPLAVTSPYRSPYLPDVPTMQEAGFPQVTVTSWIMLYGPPALPAALRDPLSDAALAAVNADEGKRRLETAGFELRPLGAAEATAFQEAELTRWTAIARRVGIQVTD